ncbi:MAG: Wzz/FepE/Etk N-terminal domain-containing protein [Gammaproteobacteria bacterium]
MNRLPQSTHVEGLPTRERGLSDYLAIVRRRKKIVVSAIALISLVSFGIAWGLPPVYSSSATILNEQQEISQDFVRSTVTSFAFERIEIIKQKLMTRQNLKNIVNKYKLSGDDAAKLQDAIRIEMINAKVLDPTSGRESSIALAFKLSYDNGSPQLAYNVARELVSIFLTENRKSIETNVRQTSAFLRSEAEKLGLQIGGYEKKLAEFKEKNAGKLPELVDLNMQLLHRTETEMADVLRQIQSLMERRVYFESELAQIDPYGPVYSVSGGQVLSPAGRLKSLQTEFLSVSARYSSDHPDVIRLRKEIDGLRKETGVAVDTGDLAVRLEASRSELLAARQKYSEDHPDVRRLVQTVQRMENELSKAPARALRSNPAPDNPVYIQLQTQLKASDVELASQQARAAELRRKHAVYEQRLTQTPQIEREYKTLMRDYEGALEKYRDVATKQKEAQLSQTLESEKKGQRFTVIEPPVLPNSPAKPNRLGIALIGFIVSIFGGMGSAAMAEARDTSVRGREGVISLFGVPPLAAIPYIETQGEIIRKRSSRYVALGVIGVVGVVLLAAHLFVMPLEELVSFLEAIGIGNDVKG